MPRSYGLPMHQRCHGRFGNKSQNIKCHGEGCDNRNAVAVVPSQRTLQRQTRNLLKQLWHVTHLTKNSGWYQRCPDVLIRRSELPQFLHCIFARHPHTKTVLASQQSRLMLPRANATECKELKQSVVYACTPTLRMQLDP